MTIVSLAIRAPEKLVKLRKAKTNVKVEQFFDSGHHPAWKKKIDVVNVVHMLARDVFDIAKRRCWEMLLRDNSKICKKISPR